MTLTCAVLDKMWSTELALIYRNVYDIGKYIQNRHLYDITLQMYHT